MSISVAYATLGKKETHGNQLVIPGKDGSKQNLPGKEIEC
jgi:hypothetical protein